MSARTRGLLLGVVVSVLAAALLAATTDLRSVGAELAGAQLAWLIPGLLVLAAQAWIRATRWASLLGSPARPAMGAGRVLDAMLLGYFVNAILPARLGEVARALVVARREGASFGAVAATVVVERAVDVLALAALAGVALITTGRSWSLAFLALAAGIGIAIILSRRAARLTPVVTRFAPTRIATGMHAFLEAMSAIPFGTAATAAALSAIAWLADAAMVLLVARALGVEIPAPAALLIGLGGALGTALPAAPGYLATYELGAVALGAIAGLAPETVLPVAILTHLIGVTVLAAAGAAALGRVSGLVQLGSLAGLSARGMQEARTHGDG